ncbi:MAG TPA: vWA domain-containing protein [Kofleriaceae bacterium]
MQYSRILSLILVAAAACGQSSSNHKDAGSGGDDDGGNTGDDGDMTCTAPNMLILLDRTGTMHRNLAGATPTDDPAGHATAKFTIAINALDALMATPGLDQSLRLGLAMFPRDPGGGKCITLSQRLSGSATFMNPPCEAGEVVVEPALGTAASIAASIDPETTTICNTTPIGAGLQTAQDDLVTHAMSGVDQYIMLVTDGADFADSCPTPDPLEVLRTLDAAGTKTFIVGFGAQDTTTQGVNPPVLNQLACAGHTAKDFATNCKQVAGGGYDAVDPMNGPPLYYDAADATALAASLRAVAGSVCCGCIF